MPQPTGDIIEVTLVGEQNGQEVSNVLHFERLDANETAEDIAQAAAAKFITTMLPNFAEEYTLTHVNFRNLFDGAEAGSLDVLDTSGGRTNVDVMPPHDTVSIQLLHNEATIRSGRKSLAGLAEDHHSNGVITAVNVAAIQSDALDWLTEPLKDIATGVVDTARPVVVKRIAELVGGVTKYRLPVSIAEAVVGAIFDVITASLVRTQNSRKIGRGS